MGFAIAVPLGDGPQITYQWYDSIPQPQNVVPIPPPSVGNDAWGAPQVRGYGDQTWTYKTLGLFDWYSLIAIWNLTRNGNNAWGRVFIRWPDPQSGQDVIASARMEAPTVGSRVPAAIQNGVLKFTHIGIDDTAATGYYLPPADNGAPGR
jgi:hypothetical protein